MHHEFRKKIAYITQIDQCYTNLPMLHKLAYVTQIGKYMLLSQVINSAMSTHKMDTIMKIIVDAYLINQIYVYAHWIVKYIFGY